MNEILSKTSKLLEKEEKAGETNGRAWVRYVLTFDGLTGSTFDAELVKEVKAGETYKVTFKKSGVYNNIVDLEKVESKPEIKPANEVKPSDFLKETIDSNVWLEKDKRIVRQNCNQRAIELAELMVKADYENLQALIKDSGSLIKVIDKLAKHFEEIVYRDYKD